MNLFKLIKEKIQHRRRLKRLAKERTEREIVSRYFTSQLIERPTMIHDLPAYNHDPQTAPVIGKIKDGRIEWSDDYRLEPFREYLESIDV